MATVTPDWEASVTRLGGELVEALKPVAAKMGVAAERLYGVLVRQSIADSVAYMIGWGIVGLFGLYMGNKLREFGAVKQNSCEEACVFGWFITGLSVFILSMTVTCNISGIINPEYYAIKTLLDAVKR